MSAELKAREPGNQRYWKEWKDRGAVGNRDSALIRSARVIFVPSVNTSFGEVLDDGRIVPMNGELVELFLGAMDGPLGEILGAQPEKAGSDDRELFNRLRGLTNEEQMRLIAQGKAGKLYTRFRLTSDQVTEPMAVLGLYPRLTSKGVEADLEVLHSASEETDVLPVFAKLATLVDLPADVVKEETQLFADSGFDTPEHLQNMMVGLAERDLPSALLVLGVGTGQASAVEFISHTLTPTIEAFAQMQKVARHTLVTQQVFA